MAPRFTVLLPVIRPPLLLPLAAESVLEQTLADFELCVICDGAPPETVACAEAFSRRDKRVKVFAHPKGERHGEAWRHQALARSEACHVAHIGDDDLWFPDHLAEMDILLSQADFGNLLHVYVHPGDRIELLTDDLGRPETRRRMLNEPFNIFGMSHAGYRLDAYRRLPQGWAPAPPDVWSDLHMWRKFLAMDGLTCATRAVVTALHFAAPQRTDVTLEQRLAENYAFLDRIRDPRQRDAIVQAAWLSAIDKVVRHEERIEALAREHGDLAARLDRMTTERDAFRVDSEGQSAARSGQESALGEATGERDRLQTEVDRLAAALAQTQSDLDRLVRSKSWRLTAPLRVLLAKARGGN
jgi:succinoglycan biosynthesis protein ExoW